MLSEFIDGALDSEGAWTVRMHVSSCQSCAEDLRLLEGTVSLLRSTSQPQLSERFDASLALRIEAARHLREESIHGSVVSRTLFGLRSSLSANRFAIGRALRLSAPVVAGACVMAFLIVSAPSGTVMRAPKAVAVNDTSGFVKACQHEQQSYLAGQPFADPSAQALMQRQTDDALSREGAVLLGSGNI